MLRRLAFACFFTATLMGATAVSAAEADAPVLPDTAELPWSDPNHNTALERLASTIASTIAQREVRVYCNGQADWNALAARAGFDAGRWWGYVPPPPYWYPLLGTFAVSSTHTQLSPIACERLWLFGKAAQKPTKCAASQTVTEVVPVKVAYRATVRVRVKQPVRVKGRWVTRYVWRTREVTRTRTEMRQVTRSIAQDPQPCFGAPQPNITISAPQEGWGRNVEHAVAIATLAHEAVHLYSFTAGRPVPKSNQEEESRAECWGMQLIPQVAQSLGASPEDGAAIAAWYAATVYPTRQTSAPEYWSVDCKPDGALDRTPGDGRWP